MAARPRETADHDGLLDQGRSFLKDTIRQRTDFSQTEQSRGLPPPPIEKPFGAGARRVDLPKPGSWSGVPPIDFAEAVRRRESRRRFRAEPLTLDELAFLLWVTQGVRRVVNPAVALRTVPSAGARHALETYILAINVHGLAPGAYRYLPLEHQLVHEFADPAVGNRASEAALGQRFVGQSAAVFVWAAVPRRMEWRYGPASHKVIALDAGHVCQNLYLACEAISAGTCAVAAYDQAAMDSLLRLDGREEFVVYLAPVGKV
jgi:SagB-type dehydrogenase family enzyme